MQVSCFMTDRAGTECSTHQHNVNSCKLLRQAQQSQGSREQVNSSMDFREFQHQPKATLLDRKAVSTLTASSQLPGDICMASDLIQS